MGNGSGVNQRFNFSMVLQSIADVVAPELSRINT